MIEELLTQAAIEFLFIYWRALIPPKNTQNNEINGLLSNNGDQILSGTWNLNSWIFH